MAKDKKKKGGGGGFSGGGGSSDGSSGGGGGGDSGGSSSGGSSGGSSSNNDDDGGSSSSGGSSGGNPSPPAPDFSNTPINPAVDPDSLDASTDPIEATDPTQETESGLNTDPSGSGSSDSGSSDSGGDTSTDTSKDNKGSNNPQEDFDRERSGSSGGSDSSESDSTESDSDDTSDVGEGIRSPELDAQAEEFTNDGETAEAIEEQRQEAEAEAAENIDEQTDSNFTEEDVEATVERNDSGELVIQTQLTDQGESQAQLEQDFQEAQLENEVFNQLQSQTEANLTRDQVDISTGSDGVTATLTDSGRRQEAAAQSSDFEPEDFLVTRDGDVFLSNEAQREAIASENEGVSPEDVILQDERQEQPQTFGEINAAINADGPTGGVTTNVDIAGTTTTQTDSDSGDFLSGTVSGAEDLVGVDTPGDGSVLNDLAQSDSEADIPDSGEIFDGDGVVGGGPVESTLRGLSQDYQSGVVDPVSNAAGEAAASDVGELAASVAGPTSQQSRVAQQLGEEAAGEPDVEDPRTFSDEQRQEQVAGVTQSALGLADVPRLGVVGIEAAEVGVDLAGASPAVESGSGSEDFGEFGQRAGAAGSRTLQGTAAAAQQNPARFGGQLLAGVAIGSAAETAIRSSLRGTPDTDVDTPSGRQTDTDTDTTTTSSSSGSRTPLDVDVGTDATSGRVDINVNSDLTRRIDQEINRVRNVPGDVADRARQVPQQARETASDAAESATQSARNAEVSADANLQAARQTASDAAESAVLTGRRVRRDFDPAQIPTQAQFVGSQAADAATDTAQSVRNRAVLAGRRARRDLGLPTIPRGFLSNRDSSFLSDTGTARRNPGLSAVNLGFAAGQQARRTAQSAAAGLQQGIINTEATADAAVQSGRATASAARTRAVLAGRRARRDLNPYLPRGFATDSEPNRFLSDTGTGRTNPGLAALNLGSEVADTARSGANILRNLGVRIDVGKPSSRSVDVDSLDIDDDVGVTFRGDTEADTDDVDTTQRDADTDGETDGDTDGDTQEPAIFEVDSDDAGDGTVTLRQSEQESDAPTRRDTDGDRDTGRDPLGGVGGAVGGATGVGSGAGTGTGATPSVGTTPSSGVGFGQGPTAGLGPGLDLGQGPFSGVTPGTEQGVGPDTGVDSASGVDSGTRFDSRANSGTESESFQELRQEARAETRQESRRRVDDIDFPDLGLDDDSRRFDGVGGTAEGVITNFGNPLTGEILETETSGRSGDSDSLPGFGDIL